MIKSILSKLLAVILLSYTVSLWAQTPKSKKEVILDTIFTDLSSRYQIMIPGELSQTIKKTNLFNIAIVPLGLIGKVEISWDSDKKQLSHESETEFETNMLNCLLGKDKKDKNGNPVKLIKRQQYCERVGYQDAAMGKYSELHYCSFVKEGKLVVIEYSLINSNCGNGRNRKEAKLCEAQKSKFQQTVNNGIAKIVNQIKIKQLSNG